jgi:hypothetical protein
VTVKLRNSTREVGKAPRNVNSHRKDGATQVRPVKGNCCDPSPQGIAAIKGSVNSPKP